MTDTARPLPPLPAGYRLRPARAADMAGLWEVRYGVLENTLTPGRISDEDVRAAIEDTGCGWVVECLPGSGPDTPPGMQAPRIDGFVIGQALTGNVWALFVHPRAQGLGLGEALHARLLAWFATQAAPRLWLSTGVGTRALGFYLRRGWQDVGPYGAAERRLERPNP